MKKIVTETETKYKTQKVIVSFTPAFPIVLLRLGVSPFDDMCVKPIIWLKKNKTKPGWNLPGYSDHALSFTSAYSLWTINEWHKHMVREMLTRQMNVPFIIKRLRNRVTFLLILVLLPFCMYVLLTQLISNLYNLFINITETYGVLISGLASILAILGIPGIIQLVKYIDSRFLGLRIRDVFSKFSKIIRQFIYVE